MVYQTRLVVCCLLCCWSSISSLFATSTESLPYRHYGTELGLSASDIYALQIGPRGRLWVGSGHGLHFFDGHQFQRVGGPHGPGTGLFCYLKCVGPEGLLAVGQRPNFLYYIQGEEIRHQIPLPGILGIGRRMFYSETAHRLTWTLGSTCFEYDLATEVFRRKLTHRGQEIAGLIPRNGRATLFYFAGQAGLFTATKGDTVRFAPTAMPFRQVHGSHLLSDAAVLLWTDQGLWRCDTDFSEFEAVFFPDFQRYGIIRSFIQDQRGRIWFYPDHGGLYYLENGQAHAVENEYLGTHCQVNALMEDAQGNIWVGTEGKGLVCFLRSGFRNITTRNGLNSDYITTLALDPVGNLYIGSNAGLNVLDATNRLRGAAEDRWHFSATPKWPADDFALQYTMALESGPGRVLICCSAGGIRRGWLNRGPDSLFIGSFASALQLGDSVLVLGQWGTLTILQRQGEDWVRDWAYCEEPRFGRVNVINYHQDTLWFGTLRGLYYVCMEDMLLQKVAWPGGPGQGTSSKVYALAWGEDGLLYLGSSAGLWRRSPQGWQELTPGSGESVVCRALTTDQEGRLWVGTDRGLALYHQQRWVSLGTSNGLAGHDVRRLLVDSARHTLWVGTTTGLSAYDLRQEHAEVASQLHWLSVRELHQDQRIAASEFRLPHRQNSLHIRFSALHHAGPDEVDYQYRLHHQDSTWQSTSSNEAWLLSLSPGPYQFQARCRIPGRTWSPPATLRFEIAPPFWQEPLFLLAALLLTIALTAALFIRRGRHLQRRESEKRNYLRNIHHLEQRVLRASLNPHFVFNALNAIQHFFIRHQDQAAIGFTNGLARLIRLNMDSAHQKTISLQEELHRLQLYLDLEKLRLQEQLTYRFEVDGSLKQQNPMVPNMVLQPIVENAIWHGIAPARRPGTIVVRMYLAAPHLLIAEVDDDGVGLDHAAQKDSFVPHRPRGLALIRERLQLYDARNSLVLEAREDQGTRARFRIVIAE